MSGLRTLTILWLLLACVLAACGTAQPSAPAPTPTVAVPAQTSPLPAPTTPAAAQATYGAGDIRTRSPDGMVMVYVPAGEFIMGSPRDVGHNDERPDHRVTLDGFWIDRTEVSNDQYRRCLTAGACREPQCWDDRASNAASQPVVCVSWDEAVAYCQWAGARLPTEAEWEKAARGTDGQWYPWGDEPPDCERANHSCTTGSSVGRAAAVGSYPSGASPYGALDMAGNVDEWVGDWYGEAYYSISPGSNPLGPDSGTARVMRGGSYLSQYYFIRSAERSSDNPAARYHSTGFRCASSSTPAP